jgi:hypothetical protein
MRASFRPSVKVTVTRGRVTDDFFAEQEEESPLDQKVRRIVLPKGGIHMTPEEDFERHELALLSMLGGASAGSLGERIGIVPALDVTALLTLLAAGIAFVALPVQ